MLKTAILLITLKGMEHRTTTLRVTRESQKLEPQYAIFKITSFRSNLTKPWIKYSRTEKIKRTILISV